MWGFEEDDRAAFLDELRYLAPPFAGLLGKEPLEDEPACGKTGDGNRGYHRARAWDRFDREPLVGTGLDEPVTGIGEARHPCIGHDDHVVTGPDGSQQI